LSFSLETANSCLRFLWETANSCLRFLWETANSCLSFLWETANSCLSFLWETANNYSPSDIFSINRLIVILQIIGQCEVKAHNDVTDKNNNISFEGLNIYYHSSSYRTRCDTTCSDNVCLDLQNWRYSIYIMYVTNNFLFN
jgi:hypothetical protein